MATKKSPSLAKLQKDLASCNERNRKLAAKLRGTKREGGVVGKAKDYLFGKPVQAQSRLSRAFVRSSAEAYEEAHQSGSTHFAIIKASPKELTGLFGRSVRTDDGPVWYIRRGSEQLQIWFPRGTAHAQAIGTSSTGVEALRAYVERG